MHYLIKLKSPTASESSREDDGNERGGGGGGIVSHRGLSLGGSDHFRVLGFPSVRGLIGDSTALVRTRTNGRRADVV